MPESAPLTGPGGEVREHASADQRCGEAALLSDEAGVRPAPREATEVVSALERYKLARSQVEHENTLVGQRITWYLTLQGFLFTAVFITATTLLDPGKSTMHPMGRLSLAIAVGFLCFLGVASSVACFLLIRAAYAQIDRVATWWNAQGKVTAAFPAISGTGGFELFGYRVSGADFVLVLLVTWIAILGLLIRTSTSGA